MNRYRCPIIYGMAVIFTVVSNSCASDNHELKQHLEETQQRFKKNNSNNEQCVEQILRLLQAELTLVEYLQTNQTGVIIEDAVTERDCLLAQSVPSVVYLYDVIMNFATWDPLLTSDNAYLNYHERVAYFNRMVSVLEHQYHEFETIQHQALRAYRM